MSRKARVMSAAFLGRGLVAAAAIFLAAVAYGDVYLAGDSAMCSYGQSDGCQRQGWGQALASFMESRDALHNCAVAGRSARSFKNEGRWQRIADSLRPGDIVIISFGRNDSRRDRPERYSSPDDFKELMAGFVNDVREREAIPLLATPVPSAEGIKYVNGTVMVDGAAPKIGPYINKTLELGSEMGVDVLDLNGYAVNALPALGLEGALSLYRCSCPAGHGDNQGAFHMNSKGAMFYAEAAVRLSRSMGIPLCRLFKAP